MEPHLVEDCDNTAWRETNESSSPPVKNVLISSSAEFRPVSPLLSPPFHPTKVGDSEKRNDDGGNGDDVVANVKLDDQQTFLLFVKFSSLYVRRTKDVQLKRAFKATISKCTAENRRGNPDYTPLQKIVEGRLRKVLGEVHWNNAALILRAYCRQNHVRMDPVF